jgi:hypothetical protein
MSTELDQAREIAERIARRVSSETPSRPNPAQPKAQVSAELAAVRAGLSELQRKIAQLEAKVSSESGEPAAAPTHFPFGAGTRSFEPQSQPVPLTHSPWLAGVNASISHPSQEKFGVEEAVVAELVDHFEKEKVCSVEPGGKPCDHCAMCSSRGF